MPDGGAHNWDTISHYSEDLARAVQREMELYRRNLDLERQLTHERQVNAALRRAVRLLSRKD